MAGTEEDICLSEKVVALEVILQICVGDRVRARVRDGDQGSRTYIVYSQYAMYCPCVVYSPDEVSLAELR